MWCLLCARQDTVLEVVWKPRTEPYEQIADAWCKVQDKSDWSLHPAVFAQLLKVPVLAGRMPAMHASIWACLLAMQTPKCREL
jgi:hypothetical protein